MQKNFLEWSVFGISLALIVGAVGVLAYEQFTRTDRAPDIRVEIGQVLQRPDGYAIELLVQNHGDRTAESVHVAVSAAGSPERAETVIDYVPYGSRRRAWVTLPSDPRQGELSVRVLGYEEP